MATRIELHNRLTTMLGASHVYFQPPESVKLSYPCIIYNLDAVNVKRADNSGYVGKRRYAVTIISKDPDYSLVDEMALMPLCTFNRFFTADNLNHWTFELYY